MIFDGGRENTKVTFFRSTWQSIEVLIAQTKWQNAKYP